MNFLWFWFTRFLQSFVYKIQEVYRDLLVIKQQHGETLCFAWNKKTLANDRQGVVQGVLAHKSVNQCNLPRDRLPLKVSGLEKQVH